MKTRRERSLQATYRAGGSWGHRAGGEVAKRFFQDTTGGKGDCFRNVAEIGGRSGGDRPPVLRALLLLVLQLLLLLLLLLLDGIQPVLDLGLGVGAAAGVGLDSRVGLLQFTGCQRGVERFL